MFGSTLTNALQTVDRFKIRSPGSISGVHRELLAVNRLAGEARVAPEIETAAKHGIALSHFPVGMRL